jgi:thiamine pyrophosphokinase
MSNCLIVCDGELSKKTLFNIISNNKPRLKVISCDGASEFLRKNKITPDYIIGDLDSITPGTLAYFKKKNVTIKKTSNQNKNDLEKALDLAITRKFKKIIITGFSGKRFDHSLNNLSIIKKYNRKAGITIYEKGFEMMLINKSSEFAAKLGDIISLIPLPKASGVKTEGLKYKLNNETLKFGKREGALNEAVENNIKIRIATGDLLIIKEIH